jgi:LuxR family maltose regulon positive regulatory protein
VLLEGYKRLRGLGSFSSAFAASLLLGEAYLEKVELRRASHHYRQALAHVDENQEISRQQLLLETGDAEPFFPSWAYHSLARLAYERNELADARRYLSQALALREKPEKEVHILASGALIQARLLHASGETAQAQGLLRAKRTV